MRASEGIRLEMNKRMDYDVEEIFGNVLLNENNYNKF